MLSRREPTVDEVSILMQAGFTFYDGRDWKAEAEKMYGSNGSSIETGSIPLMVYSEIPIPDSDQSKLQNLEETFIYISEEKQTMVAIQAVNVFYLPAWIAEMISLGGDGKPISYQGTVYTLKYIIDTAGGEYAE